MIGIDLQNVTFRYLQSNVLEKINEQFKMGEKISITGENGSGKTTLLKILSTIFQPKSGRIRYFDSQKDLETFEVRKELGVCMDESHLLRHFTVFENLKLYQKLYQSKNAQPIDTWLERFRISHKKHTPIQYLSQGEQKKVSLIKSFFHIPNFIVLDEPTNSLDDDAKHILSDILQNSIADSLLVVSTHDQIWASSWANRNITLKHGRLS